MRTWPAQAGRKKGLGTAPRHFPDRL